MTITLRPEHEQLISEAMQTGAYGTPDEVIGRALEVWQVECETPLEDVEWIYNQGCPGTENDILVQHLG